jgi:hypothetical protein
MSSVLVRDDPEISVGSLSQQFIFMIAMAFVKKGTNIMQNVIIVAI